MDPVYPTTGKTYMNKVWIGAALAIFACAPAPAADLKPDNETSFNAALTSDYRFRGISQTRLRPALQGGADYVNNPSGLYAGTWLSTIAWTRDAGGSGAIEWDLYAGKRGEIVKDVSYDIGMLRYLYPSNGLAHVPGFANVNTTEAYGQIGYGPAYVKYSHALTNLFGFVDSEHSGYLDVGANIDAGVVVINLHAGRQRVKNVDAASYADWKIGLIRDFGILSAAVALIGTNAGQAAYASPANGKFLGKSAVTVNISKTF